MKSLEQVLEEYSKSKWNNYSYTYDIENFDKRLSKEKRIKFLLEGAERKRYWGGYRYFYRVEEDKDIFYNKDIPISDRIITFICQFHYEYLYLHSKDKRYTRYGHTLRTYYKEAIERIDKLRSGKEKRNGLEEALNTLPKDELIQLLILKNRQLQDQTEMFQSLEQEVVFANNRAKKMWQKMNAYRGLSCVVMDMDIKSVNKILDRVKKNKTTLQKALMKG
jgi:hypothetical protein